MSYASEYIAAVRNMINPRATHARAFARRGRAGLNAEAQRGWDAGANGKVFPTDQYSSDFNEGYSYYLTVREKAQDGYSWAKDLLRR